MRLIALALFLLFGMDNAIAQKRITQTPLIEYVGTITADTTRRFLLDDFPATLKKSSSIITPLVQNHLITREQLVGYISPCRYLSYIKVNSQSYGYDSSWERIDDAARTAARSQLPLLTASLKIAAKTMDDLQLAVDYTICLYDTETKTEMIFQPFVFKTEQSSKEKKDVQTMQPEGVAVDYPLVDKLHAALLEEYEKMLKTSGLK